MPDILLYRHCNVDGERAAVARIHPLEYLIGLHRCGDFCRRIQATYSIEANMITLNINGKTHLLDVDPATPLLWVIREQAGLIGTKFGCGIAQCGACTVHLNGAPIRSCVTPVQAAADQNITTIEGVNDGLDGLHPVQQAWIDEQVPQCGYCQSGQVMSAVALLDNNSSPTDTDIDAAMSGNICRCGTYPRIRKGIKRAAQTINAASDTEETVHG